MAEFNALWVLIPVVAILAKVAREWIRVSASQKALGTSSRETEKTVAELTRAFEAQKREMQERIENLETIVSSQTWNVIHDRTIPDGVREQHAVATARHEMRPDQEAVNRQRVEQMAQRLR
jgi:ferritin-like metal-binding protein YciE